MIPSLQAIDETLAAHTTLRVDATARAPAPHYARTLRLLARDASLDQWPRIHGPGLRRDLPPDVGVLPRLLRGGVRQHYLDVAQIRLARKDSR